MDWRIVSCLEDPDTDLPFHLRPIAFGVGRAIDLWSTRRVLAAMARGDRFYMGPHVGDESLRVERCECAGPQHPHVRLPPACGLRRLADPLASRS